MNYKETFKQSPNVSKNLVKHIGIILHHSAGSYVGSVSWCLNPSSQVSYHCMVDTNGDRTVMAKDNQRAWHAGKSTFKGRSDCNSFMLGIAVSGDTTKRLLNENEITSVAEWCVSKMKTLNIPIENITTHRHVAPGRKTDIDERAYQSILAKIKELKTLSPQVNI